MCSNQDKKVSVVIPTWNSCSTLEKCLKSIKRQSYPTFEVIIVDSFSKDSTINIAKEYGAKIITHNGLQGECREIGVKKSNGDFILFLDSDELLDNGVIQQCIELCEEGADFICFESIWVGNDFWSLSNALLRNSLRLILKERSESFCPPRFFSRKILVSSDAIKEGIGPEDYALYVDLRASGAKEANLKIQYYHNESVIPFKKLIIKEFRYGMLYSRTHHGLVPRSWSKIALISTVKEIILHSNRSPLLRLGALFLLVLRSIAGGMSIMKTISLNIKTSSKQSPQKT